MAMQRPYQNWAAGSGAQEIMVDYLYDALGRQTRVGTPWLTARYSSGDLRRVAYWSGGYTETTYNPIDRPAVITAPNGEQQTYTYAGRAYSLIGTGRNGDPNKVLKWEERDGLGNLKSVRTYNPSGSSWTVDAQVTLSYDVLGNLTSVVHPNSIGTTTMTYDLAGRKTSMGDPDLGYWNYVYDRQGKLTRQTDARWATICLYYDSLARLAGKHLRWDTNCPASPSYNVSYGYDANHGLTNRSRGQLTSVSYTNGTYSKALTYEARGLLALETVTIAGAPQSYNTYYAADSYLRPVTTTYPDNEVVTTSYNAMGLPTQLTTNQGTLVSGVWQAGTLADGVTYDEAGRLTQMRFPLGGNLYRTQSYWPWTGSSNNSNGRLNTIKVGTASGSGDRLALTYGYDSFGNIGGLTEQYGGVNANKLFCYDGQNRLLRGYDAYNLAATYLQNCAAGNNVGRTYSYDSGGRMTNYEGTALIVSASFPAHTAKNSGYTYDNNGNLQTRAGYTLEWDEENHLSAVKSGGTAIERYLYDADGMRVKKIGSTTSTYYINAFYEVTLDNPLPPTPPPPPTATPTRTPTPGPTPTRDCRYIFCTPTPPSSPSLVRQSADLASAATPIPGTPMPTATVVATQADAPVEASAVNATSFTKYYYINGQRLAMRKDGVMTYLHGDHLGSTLLETNTSGAITTDQQYYAYGRQRDTTSPVTTDHKFTGQKLDATGLMYYGARYYDPELGQFISPDTVIPDPTNLFDYNRYAYARLNPMRYNDPTGHCAKAQPDTSDQEAYTEWLNCSQMVNTILAQWDTTPNYWNGLYTSKAVFEQEVAWNPNNHADLFNANFLHSLQSDEYQAKAGEAPAPSYPDDGLGCGGDRACQAVVQHALRVNAYCTQNDCVARGLDVVSTTAATVAAGCAYGIVTAPCALPATEVGVAAGGLGTAWTTYQVLQGNGDEADLAAAGTTLMLGINGSPGVGLGGSIFQTVWDFFRQHPE